MSCLGGGGGEDEEGGGNLLSTILVSWAVLVAL